MNLYLLITLTSVLTLDPIITKGTKFFNSKTGEQFFMKGVAYQPGGSGVSDPLSKPSDCKRDAALLKELGANVVRVYESYPENNHDECMKILNDNGIYLLLDLPTAAVAVDRNKPAYDLKMYNHFKNNIDAFSKYDNTLGFIAGNEVNNDKTNTDANPFVKASLRDAKAYIKKNVKRPIPVGYANNDDADTRENIEKYFYCGKEEGRADFFGINIYRWCGKSTLQESGYDKMAEGFKDYGIPVILSEFGCNTIRPRTFGDISALFGPEMIDIFSGGVVYEYSQEANEYGIVKVDGDKVKKLEDFETLKKEYGNAKPKPVKMDSVKDGAKEIKCPAASKDWQASEKMPDTPSKGSCECMMDTLKCHVSSKFNVTKEGEKVGKMFGFLCENGADCNKYLKQDGKKGEYGLWSTCTAHQKLSWALTQAYIKAGENKDACLSNGAGEVVKPKKTDDKCGDIKADLSSGSGGVKSGSGKGASSSEESTSDFKINYPLSINILIALFILFNY